MAPMFFVKFSSLKTRYELLPTGELFFRLIGRLARLRKLANGSNSKQISHSTRQGQE
jgi:hypothetical protein